MQKITVSPYNAILEDKGRDLPDKITIYDSTLRDGEQMPGVAFTKAQKLKIARRLDAARVPQIEAGFPSVSAIEQCVVKEIVKEDLDADILVLSRIVKKDIDAAIDCGVDMVLLFVGTSDLHLKYKLHRKCEEIQVCAANMVEYAKDHGLKVSFSTEDTTRTELDHLNEIYHGVEAVGADRLGITDTVGCITPAGMRHLVKELRSSCSTPFSVHCHNDFGLALANSIAGVCAGAQAVTTTVNGMGERAGNAALEEFVMAMKALYGKDLGIDTTELKSLSELVAGYARVPVAFNKPIVGRNAFAHESGIHVAAILENPETYEPIPPAAVGGHRILMMGKHTGRKGLEHILEVRHIKPTEQQTVAILDWLKDKAGTKGFVDEAEFWSKVDEIMGVSNGG